MARKTEAAMRTWLPWIVKTYQDSQKLTTFDICKTIGRKLAALEPHEQLEEINRVLDKLVTNGFLVKMENSRTTKTHWGIDFDSCTYHTTDKTPDLVKAVNEGLTRGMQPGIVNNFHGNTQVNIDSPGAIMTLQITNTEGLDEETKQLLEDLKTALANKDQSKVKRVLGYIADKGVDVALQLALGKFLTGA